MTADDLLIKIEENRKNMIELGLSSSFIDERVINISNQLDKLLYKYQTIITKKQ
ncbi:aspartyl-phosphate phosphatase Spo0E family protein [Bacillus sp. FJAT-50079]|uniref:aspartyl-phosphate phosphatase Spo0E family protein n=1 Tax=Bacillus sp. FJAT-50079 TaxID=2833577 RepID=UPI001BC8F027|nr:aspartyl-phosphate phosphatase Spo0E family protein [Bacillus sp. FJAT-50079]MBS4210013.1 aspartyl-phosphate phosphatase Spo0E family protein [Bacillus sp. FJAT-50079]